MPSGSPDLLQQSGNDMAGWPVALNSAVKVSIGARWSNRSFTVSNAGTLLHRAMSKLRETVDA